MNKELKNARRKLSRLQIRLKLIGSISTIIAAEHREFRGLYSEAYRKMAEQSVECRRLELKGPWCVWKSVSHGWVAHKSQCEFREFGICSDSKRRAIVYAEHMNWKSEKEYR